MSLMEQFADPELMHSLSFGEKMAGSGVTALMGMGMTFLVLILLWILIAVMGRIVNGTTKKKDDKSAEAPVTAAEAPAAASAPAPAEAVTEKDEQGDVIAAVIAAAIAAFNGDEVKSNRVVRKIRRVSGQTTAWLNAGRSECIDSRKV